MGMEGKCIIPSLGSHNIYYVN
ncbi:protein of unknown function [Nitrospina watsonii]|uniref:Uncharacterized protein n=1 Tax=Nitrospina watsonii TaxID=1323948 RepID=A0ABM9HE03_9BACT|nr:protein of unknown function [Nitrospina watsonii]